MDGFHLPMTAKGFPCQESEQHMRASLHIINNTYNHERADPTTTPHGCHM